MAEPITAWIAIMPYAVCSTPASYSVLRKLLRLLVLQKVCEALKRERDRMYTGLQSISYLKPYPSHANYILCDVRGRDASQLKNTLAQKYGIMVRHYAKKELKGFIRISAGKPGHTDALLKALREIEFQNPIKGQESEGSLPQQLESEAQPAGTFAQ